MTYRQPGFDCPKDSFTDVKIPKTGFLIVHEDGQEITVKSSRTHSGTVLKKHHRMFDSRSGKYTLYYRDHNGYETFDVHEVEMVEGMTWTFQPLWRESGHIIDGQRVFTWMDRSLVKAWRRGTLNHEVVS